MGKFSHASAVGVSALLLALSASLAAAKDRVETVRFPAGKTSTTLKGAIRGYDGVAYLIEARANQTLQMLFRPSNRSCYFNVFERGAAEAVHIGSTGGNEFGENLVRDGTYKAQVYLMRNAARRGETCRYSLSVEIAGAPGGVSAGVSDAILQDQCRSEAASMYGVEPLRIAPGAVKPDKTGFRIDATADKGREGVKKLRCLFRADRSFDHIMAMTPDGE